MCIRDRINADGSKTRTVYDALGRTTESYDELGGKTATTYDANGNQLTVTAVSYTHLDVYKRQV